jgi:hypothetical protein
MFRMAFNGQSILILALYEGYFDLGASRLNYLTYVCIYENAGLHSENLIYEKIPIEDFINLFIVYVFHLHKNLFLD